MRCTAGPQPYQQRRSQATKLVVSGVVKGFHKGIHAIADLHPEGLACTCKYAPECLSLHSRLIESCTIKRTRGCHAHEHADNSELELDTGHPISWIDLKFHSCINQQHDPCSNLDDPRHTLHNAHDS